MGFFNTPVRDLFKRRKATPSSTPKPVLVPGLAGGPVQALASRAVAVQVGEMLAFLVVIGCLGLTVYCMVRARAGLLSNEEFEVYKQYNWFAVSVAAGLAVNGAMGRFNYSSSYQSQGGNMMQQQPGVMNSNPTQDPWAAGSTGIVELVAGAGVGEVENKEWVFGAPGDLAAAGQDDNPNARIDKHG